MSLFPVTETFTHERLKLGGNSLRLITLYPDQNEYNFVCCDIQQHALHRRPGYIALSYMWGSPDEKQPIWMNGKRIDVRQNLYSCLVQLRKQHNEPITLWIDALCIDQDNITERNHIVQLMDQIYERSDMVYVWLGPADESSDQAMAFLVKVATYMENKKNQVDTFLDTFMLPSDYYREWLAVLRLFKREYWNRLWIVQETLLAPSMDLFCGGYRISWKQLEQVVLLAKHSFDHFHRIRQGKSDLHAAILDTLAPRIVLQRCDSNSFTGRRETFPTLQTLLENFKDSDCFDERDEIFGLLSIAGDLHSKRADYIDYSLRPTQVFIKFLQHSLYVMSDINDNETLYNVRRLSDALRLNVSEILRQRDKNAQSKQAYNDLRWGSVDTSLAMPCSVVLTFSNQLENLTPTASSGGILRDYFSQGTGGPQSPRSPSSPALPNSNDEPSRIRDLATTRGIQICDTSSDSISTDSSIAPPSLDASPPLKYFSGIETTTGQARPLSGLACSSSRPGDILIKTIESDLYFVARQSTDKTYKTIGTAVIDEQSSTTEKIMASFRGFWRRYSENNRNSSTRSATSTGMTSPIRPTSPISPASSPRLEYTSLADDPSLITVHFNPLALLLIVNDPNWRKDHTTAQFSTKVAQRRPSFYTAIQPRGEDDPVHRSFGHRKFIGSAHVDRTANKWRDRASKKLEEMREFRSEMLED